MLTALRRQVGIAINKTHYWPIFYKRYNNVLGPAFNAKYRKFGNLCRAHYAKVTGKRLDPRDAEVFQKGSVLVKNVLPKETAEKLSNEITRRIEQNDGITGGKIAHLQIHVDRPIQTLGDAVLDAFRNKEVDAALRGFFGSYYRLVYAECYRSFPSDKPEAAWLWHTDSYPVDTCKLMVFLTDAGKDQGATLFMNREDTMAYRAAGYFGNISKDRRADLDVFAKEHGLPYRPFFHDAKKGDAMPFENNGLHRAVPPVSGYRDVLVFALLPSLRPWDEQLNMDDVETIDTSTHFPKDPAQSANPKIKGEMAAM